MLEKFFSRVFLSDEEKKSLELNAIDDLVCDKMLENSKLKVHN
jgi:hypothetical protein